MNNIAIIMKHLVKIKSSKCYFKLILVYLIYTDKLDIIKKKDNKKQFYIISF